MDAGFLANVFTLNNISINPTATDKLCMLADLLRAFNSHTNLTAITDDTGIAVLHYADSLLALPYIPPYAKLIDVGAGGGFPSLPIAIARPDVTVVALDSTAKKLAFIDEAASKLSLSNITTLNQRAEDAGRNPLYREKFTTVTARAVAKLNILCELCLPFISQSGKFIAYKSSDGQTESDESRSVCSILGAMPPQTAEFTLQGDTEQQRRILIFIQKSQSTPQKYPRQYSQIAKKPL